MSLSGAIGTAISGLSAQSAAFGNISEDVANSQTVGFKRVDTNFVDYLTTSTPTNNAPGAVVAHPNYVNNIQGSVTQTDNPLGLAIAGQGFFAVSQPIGESKGVVTYNSQQFYTRAGDFTMNSEGFLVNSAGQYLNGWSVDPTTSIVNQNALVPIQINQQTFNPQPTREVTLLANLPATPVPGTAGTLDPATNVAGPPLSSQITVYDALGTAHPVTLNWTQKAPNDWNVQMSVPDPDPTVTTPVYVGTAEVQFGALAGNSPPVPEGTIGSVIAGTSTAADVNPIINPTGVGTPGQLASLQFTANFGTTAQPSNQTITLNLGTYGSSAGVTQYAGTSYNLLGLTQDGVPPGSFSGVTTQANGNVIVNYNNGQTRTIAQIPLITFNSPNALQSQNGQAFTATPASGTPLAVAASSNGAGNLVTGSVEGSNVDIASEFSSLIVTQQAYSSNAKVVSTANTMLQATLQMVA